MPVVYCAECRTEEVLHGIYVGQAQRFKSRRNIHLRNLREGTHHNSQLQKCFDTYGESSISFYVLEECTSEVLTEREQYHVDRLRSTGVLCNAPGSVVTPERGKVWTPERKKHHREVTLGRKRSDEARARMRAGSTDKNKGRPRTEETKKKISASKQGKKMGPMAQEQKDKISASNQGKTWSEETRRKIRRSRTILSQEQIDEVRVLAKGGTTHLELAVKFGVSLSVIANITRRGGAYKDH